MFKKGMFDNCPTVLRLLHQDVPRPVTLPQPYLETKKTMLRWIIGGERYCPLGLHPKAKGPVPAFGVEKGTRQNMFPAPDAEVLVFLIGWDGLTADEAQRGMDEIWSINYAP
jgi:hypothetical protein